MAKRKQVNEKATEYEAVALTLGPKGKSGVQISSVPMKKLKALNEWHQKQHLPRKWRLTDNQERLILE